MTVNCMVWSMMMWNVVNNNRVSIWTDNLLIDYQFTFSLLQEDDQHYTAINFMATPEQVSHSLLFWEQKLLNGLIRMWFIIERSSDYQLDYIHFINDTVHSKNETSVIIVFQKPCKSHVLCRHHFLFSFHFVDQQELGHVHQCIKQFQSEHHLVSWVNRYWLLFSSFEYLPLFCCI